jgi:hypothetical protein
MVAWWEMSLDLEERLSLPFIAVSHRITCGRKRTFRLPKKQVRDMREKNQTDEERGLRSEMKRLAQR